MRMVYDRIDIAAPPEAVWDIFTNTASFPSWNPFIRKMRGDLVPGRRLHITLRMGRLMRLSFRPKVTVVEPTRQIRWLARQRIPRVLDIERAFEFTPRGDSGTRFAQFEVGRGLAAPIVMPLMRRRVAKGYAALNQALKSRAEGQGRR